MQMVRKAAAAVAALVMGCGGVLAAAQPAQAAANQQCVWTGAGGTNTFSTAKNWWCSTGQVPGRMADISFKANTRGTVNNDLAYTEFHSLVAESQITVNGNPFGMWGPLKNLTLNARVYPKNSQHWTSVWYYHSAPVTIDANSLFLDFAAIVNAPIIGTGTISLNGGAVGAPSPQFTGTIDVVGNTGIVAADAMGKGVTARNGASLSLCPSTCSYDWKKPGLVATAKAPITLEGASSTWTNTDGVRYQHPKLAVGATLGGYGAYYQESFGDSGLYQGRFNVTSAITVKNTKELVLGSDWEKPALWGAIAAPGVKIVPDPDSRAVFRLAASWQNSLTPNGYFKAPKRMVTLSGNKPDGRVYVGAPAQVTLTGVRDTAMVDYWGVLFTTAKLDSVFVNNSGTLHPGTPVGTMTSGTLGIDNGALELSLAGTGAGQYSRVEATSGYTSLGNATLRVSFNGSYVAPVGSKFVVVANPGTEKTHGTFNGLAEGATFQVGTRTMQITYAGGDGNDIQLTCIK